MQGIRYADVTMPIYQGVYGNTHVVAADWQIDVALPDGREFHIVVRKDFVFDGASIPRALWRLCGHPLEVPRIAAALAHDWLYAAHVTSREIADKIFLALCERVGIGAIRRYTEFAALRMFGGAAWKSHGASDERIARAHGSIITLTT